MRIWWQSFVDPGCHSYLDRLRTYLDEIADPDTATDVYAMTPPDRHFSRLSELRCAALAIDNSLRADAEDYDAFVMGHFQDPGLYEARSAVGIPVVGMGETSLHWAAQLGRNLALITIHSVFERWHLEQAELYGLHGRVTAVTGLDLAVEDFEPAFAGNIDATRRLRESFGSLARPLVESGADVIIPAGALPSLLLSGEHGFSVCHAPVLNCVAVTLKVTEAAVKLRALTGLGPSRGPSFAQASRDAVADFRTFVSQGRSDQG